MDDTEGRGTRGSPPRSGNENKVFCPQTRTTEPHVPVRRCDVVTGVIHVWVRPTLGTREVTAKGSLENSVETGGRRYDVRLLQFTNGPT